MRVFIFGRIILVIILLVSLGFFSLPVFAEDQSSSPPIMIYITGIAQIPGSTIFSNKTIHFSISNSFTADQKIIEGEAVSDDLGNYTLPLVLTSDQAVLLSSASDFVIHAKIVGSGEEWNIPFEKSTIQIPQNFLQLPLAPRASSEPLHFDALISKLELISSSLSQYFLGFVSRTTVTHVVGALLDEEVRASLSGLLNDVSPRLSSTFALTTPDLGVYIAGPAVQIVTKELEADIEAMRRQIITLQQSAGSNKSAIRDLEQKIEENNIQLLRIYIFEKIDQLDTARNEIFAMEQQYPNDDAREAMSLHEENKAATLSGRLSALQADLDKAFLDLAAHRNADTQFSIDNLREELRSLHILQQANNPEKWNAYYAGVESDLRRVAAQQKQYADDEKAIRNITEEIITLENKKLIIDQDIVNIDSAWKENADNLRVRQAELQTVANEFDKLWRDRNDVDDATKALRDFRQEARIDIEKNKEPQSSLWDRAATLDARYRALLGINDSDKYFFANTIGLESFLAPLRSQIDAASQSIKSIERNRDLFNTAENVVRDLPDAIIAYLKAHDSDYQSRSPKEDSSSIITAALQTIKNRALTVADKFKIPDSFDGLKDQFAALVPGSYKSDRTQYTMEQFVSMAFTQVRAQQRGDAETLRNVAVDQRTLRDHYLYELINVRKSYDRILDQTKAQRDDFEKQKSVFDQESDALFSAFERQSKSVKNNLDAAIAIRGSQKKDIASFIERLNEDQKKYNERELLLRNTQKNIILRIASLQKAVQQLQAAFTASVALRAELNERRDLLESLLSKKTAQSQDEKQRTDVAQRIAVLEGVLLQKEFDQLGIWLSADLERGEYVPGSLLRGVVRYQEKKSEAGLNNLFFGKIIESFQYEIDPSPQPIVDERVGRGETGGTHAKGIDAINKALKIFLVNDLNPQQIFWYFELRPYLAFHDIKGVAEVLERYKDDLCKVAPMVFWERFVLVLTNAANLLRQLDEGSVSDQLIVALNGLSKERLLSPLAELENPNLNIEQLALGKELATAVAYFLKFDTNSNDANAYLYTIETTLRKMIRNLLSEKLQSEIVNSTSLPSSEGILQAARAIAGDDKENNAALVGLSGKAKTDEDEFTIKILTRFLRKIKDFGLQGVNNAPVESISLAAAFQDSINAVIAEFNAQHNIITRWWAGVPARIDGNKKFIAFRPLLSALDAVLNGFTNTQGKRIVGLPDFLRQLKGFLVQARGLKNLQIKK